RGYPVNAKTQAVLFKAVPLFVLAALPAAILLGAVPFFGGRRRRAAQALRAPEPPPGNGTSKRLLDASAPKDVAVVLLDDLADRFQLDVANLALIEDHGRSALIVAARDQRGDFEALAGQRVALDREPSGINAAMREGTPFAVYDA